MSRNASIALFMTAGIALGVVGIALAQPADEEKAIKQMILRQDVVAVNNVENPDAFVPDNDPNTLQVVILNDPNAKSRVSDDGEVVFLNPNLPVDVQAALTHEAFRRKLQRQKLNATPSLPHP